MAFSDVPHSFTPDMDSAVRRAFPTGRLTLGLFAPVEEHAEMTPLRIDGQLRLAQMLDNTDIAVLWVRDRLMRDKKSHEQAEMLDVWAYLGALSAITRHITLGSASIIITLRHPITVAKAAATIDRISGGRFICGVASGVREDEYPAFGIEHACRGERFRNAVALISQLLQVTFPRSDSEFGQIRELDLLPKPLSPRIPLLVTGRAGGQTDEWIARHSDGWFQYLFPRDEREALLRRWRALSTEPDGVDPKPFVQGAFLDLLSDRNAAPSEFEQGFRGGRLALIEWLEDARAAGVNHIAFNLKRSPRRREAIIDELVEHVAPSFPRFCSAPASHPS